MENLFNLIMNNDKDGLYNTLKINRQIIHKINEVQSNGKILLHFAAQNRAYLCIEVLLSYGAEVNATNVKIFFFIVIH